MEITEKIKNRFFKKTKLSEINSYNGEFCLEWTSNCSESGYGRFKVDYKAHKAHHVAWVIKNGEIEEKMMILHHCDNRKCVNINHLFIGTHQDNVTDRVSRNRSAIGEGNGRSKLKELEVLIIRKSSDTKASLARRFGVDRKVIRDIKNGITWKYLK